MSLVSFRHGEQRVLGWFRWNSLMFYGAKSSGEELQTKETNSIRTGLNCIYALTTDQMNVSAGVGNCKCLCTVAKRRHQLLQQLWKRLRYIAAGTVRIGFSTGTVPPFPRQQRQQRQLQQRMKKLRLLLLKQLSVSKCPLLLRLLRWPMPASVILSTGKYWSILHLGRRQQQQQGQQQQRHATVDQT